MEDQYLAFVDKIGTTVEGEYIYRFDFTQAPDVVWGNSWNIVPSSIVPNISPDQQTLSLTGRVITYLEFNLAKDNSCFSMQDCIDDIIAICFTKPRNKEELILHFGESIDSVIEKLNKINLNLIDLKKINQEEENKIIDETIKALDNNDDTPPFEELGPEIF